MLLVRLPTQRRNRFLIFPLAIRRVPVVEADVTILCAGWMSDLKLVRLKLPCVILHRNVDAVAIDLQQFVIIDIPRRGGISLKVSGQRSVPVLGCEPYLKTGNGFHPLVGEDVGYPT